MRSDPSGVFGGVEGESLDALQEASNNGALRVQVPK